MSKVVRVAKGDPRVAEVTAAFVAGELPLGKADQLIRFERVTGLATKELAVAITQTSRLLTPDKDLEDDDRKAKAGRALFRSEGPAGMTCYRVVLDSEGASVVDAVLAALSAPVKGPNGEPDERPAPQRRADALVEALRRGVSSPGEAPKSDKAQVHVTIPLSDLMGEGNHGAGVTMTGQVLAPSVVRRMACDAGIIPVVLGGDGEILEMGRSERLFTLGQRRTLWLRDGGCTYPGAPCPRSGAMRTMSTGGPEVGTPTSTTRHCCASDTTPRSTPMT